MARELLDEFVPREEALLGRAVKPVVLAVLGHQNHIPLRFGRDLENREPHREIAPTPILLSLIPISGRNARRVPLTSNLLKSLNVEGVTSNNLCIEDLPVRIRNRVCCLPGFNPRRQTLK